MQHRRELGEFLNGRGLTGEMAEIGVFRGGFAGTVLERWSGRLYHAIDSWRGGRPGLFEAVRRLEREPRVCYWRMTSSQAAGHFRDGQLDAVYIDAAHDKESVYRDLTLWWPRVRTGGIVAGHDYHVGDGWIKTVDGSFECGVHGAVQQFTEERRASVESTDDLVWDDAGNSIEAPSFWIVKE